MVAIAKPYYVVIISIAATYTLIYGLARPSTHHHNHHQHTSTAAHSPHHHSNMDHSNMDHGSDMAMMPMFFQWSLDTYLWLQSIHPSNSLSYAATILLILVFAIGHEALASYRVSYLKIMSPSQQLQGYVPVPAERSKEAGQQLRYRIINSSLYAVNIATSFLLMLAVMTYNLGFFIAVVVGLGLGHFFCFKQPWHFRVDTCCETVVGAADF